MDPFIYILPSAVGLKKLAKLFAASTLYRLDLDPDEMRAAVLLDTFEGKNFKAGKILFQAGEVLSLFELQSGQLLEQPVPERWNFAGELPDGPVASQLRRLSTLRAFRPVAGLQLYQVHGRVLDDERKTCARFFHLSLRHGKKTASLGSSSYLRGYDKAHAELCRSLEGIGALSCQHSGQLYQRLGIKQQAYTTKPAIPLKAQAAVGESAGMIINTFLEIARRNEALFFLGATLFALTIVMFIFDIE